ncbi:MAG: 3'-5' exonuclease [Candidatus Lindowbacteria bacterium]|nr:3'-5' exonuclease [Candidatus Lindowbacteria bacterium]
MTLFADKKLSDLTFVAFDVETTGLDPAGPHGIVEIGAIRFDRGSALATFDQLVNPGFPMPREVVAIHGITDTKVASCLSINAILPPLLEFFGGAVLLAHNAQFDTGFLDAAVARSGMSPVSNPILCTRDLARAVFPGLASYGISNLVKALRIPTGDRHRALADAGYCAEVFKRCVDRVDWTWGITLNELLARYGGPYRQSFTR